MPRQMPVMQIAHPLNGLKQKTPKPFQIVCHVHIYPLYCLAAKYNPRQPKIKPQPLFFVLS